MNESQMNLMWIQVKQQKSKKSTSQVQPYVLSTIFLTFPSGIHYLFFHLVYLQEHLIIGAIK